MPLLRVMPPQNFVFCGTDFGSMIALDLQQNLKPFLYSSQQHMTMRYFLGIYSSFVLKCFSLKFRDF